MYVKTHTDSYQACDTCAQLEHSHPKCILEICHKRTVWLCEVCVKDFVSRYLNDAAREAPHDETEADLRKQFLREGIELVRETRERWSKDEDLWRARTAATLEDVGELEKPAPPIFRCEACWTASSCFQAHELTRINNAMGHPIAVCNKCLRMANNLESATAPAGLRRMLRGIFGHDHESLRD